MSVAPVRAPLLQRKCACGGSAGFSGACEECGKRRFGLQRRAAGPASGIAPSIVHEVLRSPGQPLDPTTRAFMEPRFGHDFSRVRVHTDARAARSADAVNALAYTVGRDVAFGAGRYTPHTNEGRKLLAHELTHVRQQAGLSAGAGPLLSLEPSADPLERDAEHTATQIADNNLSHEPSSSTLVHFATAALQRAPAAEPVASTPADRVLHQDDIDEAIEFNGKKLKDSSLLTTVCDVIGISNTPAVSDQAMALAVAHYQATKGLAQNGKVDEVTVTFIIEELQAKGGEDNDNRKNSAARAEALKGPYKKHVWETLFSRRKVLLDVDASHCECREELKSQIKKSEFYITAYQECGKDSTNTTGEKIQTCVVKAADEVKPANEKGKKPKKYGETDMLSNITIYRQSGPCGPLIDRISLAHEQIHAVHDRELMQRHGILTKEHYGAYGDPARWVLDEVSSRETDIAVAKWALGILDRICPKEIKE
jgi:hypothetical protein